MSFITSVVGIILWLLILIGQLRRDVIGRLSVKGSETIARILQPYNIRVAHKPITTLRRLLLTSRTNTNRRTDREQYTRSNAAAARLLTLVKATET